MVDAEVLFVYKFWNDWGVEIGPGAQLWTGLGSGIGVSANLVLTRQLTRKLSVFVGYTPLFSPGNLTHELSVGWEFPFRSNHETKKSIGLIISVSFILGSFSNCGKGVSFKPMTTGKMSFLNGATTAVSFTQNNNSSHTRKRFSAPSDGPWKLTPSRMTVSITGVGFLPEGSDPNSATGSVVDVSGCTATYDQSQPSLISLSNCPIQFPAGTYSAVTIAYSTTYQVLINDSAASIYSDPTQPSGLNTTAPTGGAQFISVYDTNGNSPTNFMTSFLPTPVTISAAAPPQVYEVFNPIHWGNHTD